MRVKPLTQRDWDQLLVIASGYLTLTGGNLDLAMARAIEAHARLIDSVKKGRITTRLGKGSVRLFVPDEGGLALAFDAPEAPPPGDTGGTAPGGGAGPGAGPSGSSATAARAPNHSPGQLLEAVTAPPPPLEPTTPMTRHLPPAEDLGTFPDVSFEVFERPASRAGHTTTGQGTDVTPMDE